MSASELNLRRHLTKLLSVAPVKRSRIYCGVRPSGPPDEPAGKERKALCTCVFETCTSRKRLLPRGSHGVLRSVAGPGCFASSAFNVSCVSGAAVCSEQTIRIAALKLPASILPVTAAANLLESDILLAALLTVCCAGSAYSTPLFHDYYYYY